MKKRKSHHTKSWSEKNAQKKHFIALGNMTEEQIEEFVRESAAKSLEQFQKEIIKRG